MHQRNVTCPHTSEERALTGTWCSPKLEEALQQGYKILKVHEISHFSRQSTTLFRDYIDTFLKIKQEASGWSQDVGDNPIKQRQYLLDYAWHESIELDPDKITFNPGLRSLAKMMLNSFWGKFGQQADKCQVEAFTSPAKFNELLHDVAKQIHSIRIVNEEMHEVVHNLQDECAHVQVNINIFIACFTTCWARLKLLLLFFFFRLSNCLFDCDIMLPNIQSNRRNIILSTYSLITKVITKHFLLYGL